MRRGTLVMLLATSVFVGWWAAGCGEPCTPKSCSNGCCDASGVCQRSLADDACGMNGAACQVCTPPYFCAGPSCQHADGGGAGGGGGTDGG